MSLAAIQKKKVSERSQIFFLQIIIFYIGARRIRATQRLYGFRVKGCTYSMRLRMALKPCGWLVTVPGEMLSHWVEVFRTVSDTEPLTLVLHRCIPGEISGTVDKIFIYLQLPRSNIQFFSSTVWDIIGFIPRFLWRVKSFTYTRSLEIDLAAIVNLAFTGARIWAIEIGPWEPTGACIIIIIIYI